MRGPQIWILEIEYCKKKNDIRDSGRVGGMQAKMILDLELHSGLSLSR